MEEPIDLGFLDKHAFQDIISLQHTHVYTQRMISGIRIMYIKLRSPPIVR